MLQKTSLWAVHKELGAQMVEFAGYDMPVQYTGIIDEHNTVRTAAGLFDLGHMGRVLIYGAQRAEFLDSLVTNKVLDLNTGAARYALMPNEQGGVLDDVIYYIFPRMIVLVVNASNRPKIVDWLKLQSANFEVEIEDATDDWAMIALQGPKAKAILEPLTDLDLTTVKNYRAAGGTVMGIPCMVARTGYTGEDGFELYFDTKRAPFMFRELLAAGAEHGLKACGLGARDTLRTEAGMPLYGHELSETINPIEAGLKFAIETDKAGYVGQAAIEAAMNNGTAKTLRGFFLDGRGIPRQGFPIYVQGAEEACGIVSSGTKSPTLDRALCMAFVEGEHSEETVFEIGIRKKRVPLIATKIPFYKRKRKKKKKKKIAE